ncbi:MAG: YggU family protein [Acidimicrobiales bacterium]|nr:YggU family protein [Acidimicrobiales bacterium]
MTVTADGIVLSVHAQPGAGRSQVSGRHGRALKVRVAAPPEGGRANEALAGVLAELFGVKPARVRLLSGASSRSKRFLLEGVSADEVTVVLERELAPKASRRRGDRP